MDSKYANMQNKLFQGMGDKKPKITITSFETQKETIQCSYKNERICNMN